MAMCSCAHASGACIAVNVHSERAHQLAALHAESGQGCSKGLMACAHPASLSASVPSARGIT